MGIRNALYAGSFDPMTKGHVDMIERASRIFDTLYVAVAVNTTKQALFSDEEKLALSKEALAGLDNVEVMRLTGGLTIDLAKSLNCCALIRGVRNVKDFEYETNIALMNKLQADDVETLLMLSDEKYRFVSSSLIKETAYFGGDVSALVPECVNQAIIAKFKKEDEKD
ncbi:MULTISPECIES: pantetheine-phosphate adenylyltransferase [Aerococcus]|uniref:Phosphopantetheine adenylyltransferase n=2 Tax=Aerococcus TaxID=1375 RepID=A0A178HGK0_9LACT|nr:MULTISPECIES: pantetheine-phosphate adenylyltransferase [Aerococcus]KAA9217124.1 pantetheine-phosphate adenylyltransferase [Aerococcus loyolae]KAA9265835.1 pantetheine-phosphate adenylyltransferase [Aerococcus loyolae]MCY3024827.1 pantetheine-phosphate adenylyltransferase [Aerococcus loyolae]MCY3026780.1 pantetheine-phosphate adenylyltransferase [Aerococcus loyolae]MCY3028747.1 pantetheine-phosphate adenylyltransferase [Aerococcus loyolae]